MGIGRGIGALAVLMLMLAAPALRADDDEDELEARVTLNARTVETQGEGQQMSVTTTDYSCTATVRLLLYTERLDLMPLLGPAARQKPFPIAAGSSVMRGYREGETVLDTQLPHHSITWSMKSQTIGPIGRDKRGPTWRAEGTYSGTYYLCIMGIRYEPLGFKQGGKTMLVARLRPTLHFGGAGTNPDYVRPKTEYWDDNRKAWVAITDPGRLEPHGFVPLEDEDDPGQDSESCQLPYITDVPALLQFLKKPAGTRTYSLKGAWSQENGGIHYEQQVTLAFVLDANPPLAPLN